MELKNKEKSIAIFGATGHVAKNLIHQFSNNSEQKLFLFSRTESKLKNIISSLFGTEKIICASYENFNLQSFDTIINCIGVSNPSGVRKYGNDILSLSENYDNLIIEYLRKNPSCQYINFSSGVVYDNFSHPVNDDSLLKSLSNDVSNDAYSLAKIRSENRHRKLSSFNIIDIRLFSFFSRFINLNSNFFISEIINCINTNNELITDSKNFFRDFIHPEDLSQLIKLCMNNPKLNLALDTYSISPISKYDMLKEFSIRFNLKYSFKDDLEIKSPTGFKEYYYSLSKKAKNIGYTPAYSSLETLLAESNFLIRN